MIILRVLFVLFIAQICAVPTVSQPDGAYIIVFNPDSGSLRSATARLLSQVLAAQGGRATSAVPYTDNTAWQLTMLDGSSIIISPDGIVQEGSVIRSATSLSAAYQGIQAIVVKGASAAVLAAIRAADGVAYVIPDLKVKAAVGCTDAASIAQGLLSTAAVPTTVWPGNKRCVDSKTQLVYIGERCGTNFNFIQYKAIYAIDQPTNALKQFAAKDCVLLPRAKNANFNTQRFGSCGVAPTLAPDLPTNLCPSSTDNCIAAKTANASNTQAANSVLTSKVALKVRVQCGSKRVSRLIYSGVQCGPDQKFVAWVSATGAGRCHVTLEPGFKSQHDVFGSCGVPPGEALHTMSMRICDRGSKPPGSSPGPDSPSATSPSPNPTGNPKPPDTSHALKKVPVVAGQTIPRGVAMIEAATAAGIADPSAAPAADQVLVGVLDSGVDAGHPDLSYAGGISFLDGAEPGQDQYGHGTHVAGVIGAVNNAYGVVGVSPGTGVYSIRVLDDTGAGKMSSTLAAVKWAITDGFKLGIRVLNLSLVTFVEPTNPAYAAYKAAVCQYYKEASDVGIVVTAAAGNDGRSIEGYFPAVCPHVIAVTALDQNGRTAAVTYSNWVPASDAGGVAHTLAAPGTAILSTVPTVVDPSGYYVLTGTSGAAPHVAGVAANCLMSGACKPNNTGLQSMSVIMDASKDRVAMGSPIVKYNAQDTVATGRWFGYLVYSKF